MADTRSVTDQQTEERHDFNMPPEVHSGDKKQKLLYTYMFRSYMLLSEELSKR